MKNKKKYIILVIFIIILFCLITHDRYIISKTNYGITNSIEDSKNKGVFIEEFNIKNLQIFDSLSFFPIEHIWLEKEWHWRNNYLIFKTVVIDSPLSENVLIELNNKDLNLSKEGYLKKWIILTDLNKAVGTSGEILTLRFSSKMDSILSFSIYKLKSEYFNAFDINNNVLIFKFDVQRKTPTSLKFDFSDLQSKDE